MNKSSDYCLRTLKLRYELLIHAIIQLCATGDGDLAFRARLSFYNAARAARSPTSTLLALRASTLICCSRFALVALALRARAFIFMHPL